MLNTNGLALDFSFRCVLLLEKGLACFLWDLEYEGDMVMVIEF